MIKWPNDIMFKGSKAGGILIENSWRGNAWSSSVIGIGLNLSGRAPFPNATCLLPNGLPSETTASELRQAILPWKVRRCHLGGLADGEQTSPTIWKSQNSKVSNL